MPADRGSTSLIPSRCACAVSALDISPVVRPRIRTCGTACLSVRASRPGSHSTASASSTATSGRAPDTQVADRQMCLRRRPCPSRVRAVEADRALTNSRCRCWRAIFVTTFSRLSGHGAGKIAPSTPQRPPPHPLERLEELSPGYARLDKRRPCAADVGQIAPIPT